VSGRDRIAVLGDAMAFRRALRVLRGALVQAQARVIDAAEHGVEREGLRRRVILCRNAVDALTALSGDVLVELDDLREPDEHVHRTDCRTPSGEFRCGYPVVRPEPPAAPHEHRASCHGAIGELQCGYPA